MKKSLLLLAAIAGLCLLPSRMSAQNKLAWFSYGAEWNFSFATIEDNGIEKSSILRFSPFINGQLYLHFDPIDQVGFFTGIAHRNVGFIYKPDDVTKKKYRVYNAGVPLGVELGRVKKAFFYGGYEWEFPFHYKEKTFINGKKTKFGIWFPDRTPHRMESAFAGIQFAHGINLKFKYYITEFFNRDFTETVNGQVMKPYENLKVHVMYVSLNFNMLGSQGHQSEKTKDEGVTSGLF